MLSMQWLSTVVTLGLFWLVTTQGLALEMVSALLVFLMEMHQFVNVSLCLTHALLYSLCTCIPPCTYIVTCVLPTPPLNGALFTNTNPTESSVITFQCDPGFSLVGAETATCKNSGLWDPDPALLECKFILCLNACMPVCCILTYRCGCIECCCSIWWSCCYSGGTDLTGRRISLSSHYHKEKKK